MDVESGPETDSSAGDRPTGVDELRDHGQVLDVAVRLRTLLSRPIAEEELLHNTRMVATPPEERDRLDASLLLLRLGGERLAIDVAFARRVVPVRVVHRVPHRSNDLFAGLCSVQGELIPVIRLDRMLGLGAADAPSAARRMVVVGEAAGAWAFDVDAVDGIRRFDSAAFIAPPSTVLRAIDGVTDAMVPLGDGTYAARLQPARLVASFARCLA